MILHPCTTKTARNFAIMLFSMESTSSQTFIKIGEGLVEMALFCDDLEWNDSSEARLVGFYHNF
jgi:hypothetical protein